MLRVLVAATKFIPVLTITFALGTTAWGNDTEVQAARERIRCRQIFNEEVDFGERALWDASTVARAVIAERDRRLPNFSFPMKPSFERPIHTRHKLLSLRTEAELVGFAGTELDRIVEDLPTDVITGPIAQRFLDMFYWRAMLHSFQPHQRTQEKLSLGVPHQVTLQDLVHVESYVTETDQGHTFPGRQTLSIHLKVSGELLQSLIAAVESHHLSRYGITSDKLSGYGENYDRLKIKSNDNLRTSEEFQRFLYQQPLRTRAIQILAQRIDARRSDIPLVSVDQSPIGTVDKSNPQAAQTPFRLDKNAIYNVELFAQPDLSPEVFYFDNWGKRRLENYASNRFRLMQFFLEEVLPLLGSSRRN